MDIVLVSGYQLGEPLLVEVVRNGTVVGKAQGPAYDTPDGPGFEINHGPAGDPVPGDCWDNFTPDIIPGDTIRVTAGDPTSPRVVDTSVVSDIRFTDGPRRDASGNVIVEGEAVGPNGVGRLPADQITADVRVISPRIRPGAVPAEYTDLTGTHWRATYTASTPGVIEAAGDSGLTVEQVLQNLATNTSAEWTASHVPGATEETVADFGETGGPGPGCEGSPRQQNTVVADDAAININSGTLVVSGTASQGTAKVELSVSDGTTTLNADATASLTPNAAGAQTWSHTFERADLETLNDGNVTVRATFDGTVGGDAVLIKKDTKAPEAPTATPPAGTYQQSQSVTLNLAAGEADTTKIRYTKGTATVAAPTATSGTVFTTDILVTAPTAQTIKAVAIDAAGNVGPVAVFDYSFDSTPPDAPSGLVATGGDSRVSLNWDDNVETDLAGYEVYRSTNSGGPYTKISGASLVATSDYSDTNVTNGFTYYYVVKALDNGRLASANSNQASATPRAPVAAPSAPTGLAAKAGDAKVDLSWTAVSGATGYNIYRSTTSGSFTGQPVNGTTPVTTASFSDTGLTNGTQYFYVVRAVNDGGESANSAQVSETPTAPAPSAPTGLTPTAGDGKVDLRWDAVTGATTYNVYRASGGGALTRIASPTPATATTFTDSGLTNGTTYTYAVRAVNANGESANSNQVTATPVAPAAGGTFTFAPAADVYVSQASPTTASNGSELQAVGGSTSAKQSYLRFTVSGLPAGASVSSAKLRLFVTNDSTSGGVFNKITNTTFAETINWNTKPAIDGPQVGSLGAVALNTFQEITLPVGTVTGNGSFAFAIRLPSNVTNTVGYASRSHATVANRPQLIVTT